MGDPTVFGWVTVVLYLFAAFLASRVAREDRGQLAGAERLFWRILAVSLAALGVNKQLDLQTAFTELGRIVAERQGWYDDRATVQRWFIASVMAVAALLVVAAWRRLRGAHFATRIAMLGTVALGVFVVTRASSFHNVDLFLGSRTLGLRWNNLLEISGITTIVLAALLRRRKVRRERAKPPVAVTVLKERTRRR